MGKKRRLNKFISKWIESDLPEERSTVLLLGVTKIPTSPPSSRRPCSLPLAPSNFAVEEREANLRRNSLTTAGKRSVVRRSSSKKADGRRTQVPTVRLNSVDDTVDTSSSTVQTTLEEKCSDCMMEGPGTDMGGSATASSNCVSSSAVMERSADSIGTCSLDVEASADLSDWSEVSSIGTLRSASIITPSPEPHLPSYLSLACTVNGYSTTTNYDPIRLARSRDASPHRIDSDLTHNKATYSVQNNLLSPPNLVPLPTRSKPVPSKMENTLTQHHLGRYYSSSKTMTFLTKETHTSNLFTIAKDTTDGCLENGHHHVVQNKFASFESKDITSINVHSKCTSETSVKQEYSNGTETKSFIQQRVERLYGPGALAQGFFVTKRQKNRLSESEDKNTSGDSDKHSKSMSDKLLDNEELEPTMKQSTSSPTLPVLRHLRPEFRAQLPIISTKKGLVEGSMQKSVTVPKLKDEVAINGHSKIDKEIKLSNLKDSSSMEGGVTQGPGEKDGHYFLKILEGQTKRILELAARVEGDISTPDLPEEVIGKLRSVAGKAKLLVNQKMQQFKGLCTNNINQTAGEAFPTTNEDLQGFWDMVMLQVDQVDALFEEVNVLKANNWIEVEVEKKVSTNGIAKTKKIVNRTRPTSAVNEEARKQREMQMKKIIEERRKAMKAQQSKPRDSIEIFMPDSS